ncbi:MAG: hypothetical protein AAGU17_08770 [Anaerolineaceae bacterium]|jgi:fatty acid-binding protein DegV
MGEDFARDVDKRDNRRLFITHTLTDKAFADAHFIRSEIEKLVAVDEILVTTAGETIARHCGTETVGMLYLIK